MMPISLYKFLTEACGKILNWFYVVKF